MKEIKNKVLKTYKYGDYLIYLIEEKDSYDFYLQNKEYGVISLMLGIGKNENSIEEAEELVQANLENHIETYNSLYED